MGRYQRTFPYGALDLSLRGVRHTDVMAKLVLSGVPVKVEVERLVSGVERLSMSRPAHESVQTMV